MVIFSDFVNKPVTASSFCYNSFFYFLLLLHYFQNLLIVKLELRNLVLFDRV